MQKDRLNLYILNMKYVRDLSKIDDRVMSNSPQVHKENRPFVGIIVILKKNQYCIPLTSPKPKHEKMKNDLDFSKIYDKKGKLIGALNFNNMIPVSNDVIIPLDIKPHKNDSPKDKVYKELLNNQLDWCNENIDNITKKANKLYQFVTITPEKSYSLTRRCCDFKKLERVLEKWISKELDKCSEILNANPKLKADLNAAAVEYYRIHNLPPLDSSASIAERYEMQRKVLEANPSLMKEYSMAENKYNLKNEHSQQQPKPKHRR